MKTSPNTLLVAVTVIFVGVVLLLGNMGILPNGYVAMWPVILIVAGLIGLTILEGSPLKRSSSASTTSSKSVAKSSKKKSAKKRK